MWIIALSAICGAQELVVSPFLQSVTTQSAWVVWETSAGSETVVEWGTADTLGNTATGNAFHANGDSFIHQVEMSPLQPNTAYHYRVITDNLTSDTHRFITPPDPASNSDFRLVAMSDMQKDSSNPDKFREVVEDGVLGFVASEYGEDLASELGLVLVPGDLVDNGWEYDEWETDFFGPATELMHTVPLYPVAGNHENDAEYYFDYFRLPENGTVGFEEHWWYTDYSNLRVIGLDSNSAYRTQTQLAWLEEVLADACLNVHIDFVFAQLHHPHKSELWTAGETDWTGEVIAAMETFSLSCQKPSLHFFGHTHGYSRGQSLDHQHLWVNVATAGGSIDYWGEYVQRDYDEFTVSQDEWGFVVVEVTAGDTPEFTLKRVSRGNEITARNNEIRDSITIRTDNTPPQTPTTSSPLEQNVLPECVTLVASEFSDADEDVHQGTHWQISTSCDDFSDPVAQSWRQSENWYYNNNKQADDDLTDEAFDAIDGETDYCWRVRYRDSGLKWSQWSEPASFSTATSTLTGNLLTNPGAEDGTSAWSVDEGYMQSLTSGECNGTSPHTGERYFAVGGLCGDTESFARAHQRVQVEEHAKSIDAGDAIAWFEGYLSDWSGDDIPEMYLELLDSDGSLIATSNVITSAGSTWTLVSGHVQIPPDTRAINVVLTGTRNAGDDNDSYFDDLSLRLGFGDCGDSTPTENDTTTNENPNCGCATSSPQTPLIAILIATLWVRLRTKENSVTP